jgi:hypothetical protein
MALGQREARDLIAGELLPAYQAERSKLDRIDRWYRWDHEQSHAPRQSTVEYRQLVDRAQTPWLGLVVTSAAQSLYVEGYRSATEDDNSDPWFWWQRNGMDRHQIAIHRAALAYGYSFATVLPGVDQMTGEPMPAIRGVSPRRMTAFYLDPARDDWPAYALEAEPAMIAGNAGHVLKLYDDDRIWRFHHEAASGAVELVTFDEHNLGVCPVVRYTNTLDLEGRADGEVEPFIPLAARIDQTTFDRLVVQRFASWKVRTIAGMAKPEASGDAEAEKLRLRVEDILIAADPDTKFGTLDETPLGGFIDAAKADKLDLAAVSQTPAHEMLGQMANLSAEALAAARASLTAKVDERQHSLGESHEQTLRLAAFVMGDEAGARDFESQVRWRDTEIRSLAQAADALGKFATMLGVPVEILWEKIPGWTQQDVERARAKVQDGGGIDALLRELSGGQVSAPDPVDEVKSKADAMGVLIRSGASPESAAESVGLDGLTFTGAVPVSLRLPESEAQQLEEM